MLRAVLYCDKDWLLLICVVARQAVTDGFHFSDDILSCLHSFPLELVCKLRRRRTSQCGSELELSQDTCTDRHHSLDASVEDLPSDSSPCEMVEQVSCVRDEPMDDHSASVVTATNTESVDMADSDMVSSVLCLLNLSLTVQSICSCLHVFSITEYRKYDMLGSGHFFVCVSHSNNYLLTS